MSIEMTGDVLPEVLALPLDPEDPRTLAAAHLLLTEVGRFAKPTYESSQQEAVTLIKNARGERPGTAAIYAIVDPETGHVAAAADVRHRAALNDGKLYEGHSYVNKVAVDPNMRRGGLCRQLLERIDCEAQRRGDVSIHLCALVPEVFRRCGFVPINDYGDKMAAPTGAVAGLQIA